MRLTRYLIQTVTLHNSGHLNKAQIELLAVLFRVPSKKTRGWRKLIINRDITPEALRLLKSLQTKESPKVYQWKKDPFYKSYEWATLRYQALQKCGRRCGACNREAANGVWLNVDHIKPRKKYPALALDINNLQVLCNECNKGKGNWDETDWRK